MSIQDEVNHLFDDRNKQRRGEITQKKILDTALKLFAQKGYDRVSVDEICKKSGTSKGSFYQHFSAKSDLFLMKFLEADVYYVKVMDSLPEEMDVYEKVSIFFHKAMCFLSEEMGKDLMKVMYSSALTSNEHSYFLNKDRKLTHIFVYLSREILKSKGLEPTEQRIQDILTIMTQSMMGMIYHWCICKEGRSLEDLASNATAVMIEGLKNWKAGDARTGSPAESLAAVPSDA